MLSEVIRKMVTFKETNVDIKDKLNEYIKNEYVNDNWIEELFSIRNIMCDEVEDIYTYIDEI